MARSSSARRTPRSPLAIGVIAAVVIVVITYLGFTKDIPFTTPFQIKANFESATSIRPGSPVRIAGVNVGKVKAVEPVANSDTSVVVLQINKQGLPIHEDATAKIRPRIFLEGNFFVDLKPGTPEADEISDGGVIKVTNTASPVQLDEVLTSLQSDTRQDLKDVLGGLATALNSKPSAADDKDADRSARGETAAESFNDAYRDIPAAERSTAQVFEAFLGQEPGEDLSRLIDGAAKTSAALTRNEESLKDLVTNFNTTMAAFASEAGQPADLDPRAGADAGDRQRHARLAQRGVPAHARVRPRDPAGRPRDAGHDRGVVPVDRADPQASSARRSWAASRRSSRPPSPTWRGSPTARSICCPRRR